MTSQIRIKMIILIKIHTEKVTKKDPKIIPKVKVRVKVKIKEKAKAKIKEKEKVAKIIRNVLCVMK